MRKKINLEQQEAKSRTMIEWALYQGYMENVKCLTSNATVRNIPRTIHYNNGKKKLIHWNEVRNEPIDGWKLLS